MVKSFMQCVLVVASFLIISQALAQDKVVVVPLGDSVQQAAPKFISINVYADPALNFDERYANLSDAGVGGLSLDVDFNFMLPPDYTPGTPMTIRVLAYARNSPCNGELSANFVYVSRPGVGEVSDGTSSLSPPSINYEMMANNVPREYLFTLDNSTPLQPGDGVSFGLFGLGPVPRCDLIISGVGVYYE
jgi:hypothetical protein